jgi:anti-sigma B factor antagonist
MNVTTSQLLVWEGEEAACVRVCGRANFATSVEFKRLMQHFREASRRRVVLDLSECVLMDSTFLGVLANEGHKRAVSVDGRLEATLELVNPSARVRELIDNLGVSHLFRVVQLDLTSQTFEPVPADPGVSRQDITRTCLEAHEALMALNPANIAKFKDVAQFFAETLQKEKG